MIDPTPDEKIQLLEEENKNLIRTNVRYKHLIAKYINAVDSANVAIKEAKNCQVVVSTLMQQLGDVTRERNRLNLQLDSKIMQSHLQKIKKISNPYTMEGALNILKGGDMFLNVCFGLCVGIGLVLGLIMGKF